MKQKHIVTLGTILLSVCVILLVRQFGFIDLFEPAKIKETIIGYGIWAPLMYMGLYIVACVLFIPGSPLTLAGGAIFGPLYGTIYTVIGATLGALCAFCLSRYFKKNFVQYGQGRIATTLESYDTKIAAHGFITVLFLRFVPLFPFNGLNFGLGFTKVTFREYFLGTFFGIIPGTFAYVYFGDSLASLKIGNILLAALLIIGVSYLGKELLKRYHS